LLTGGNVYRITYILGAKGPALEQHMKTLLACLTMCDRLYLRAHKGKVPPLYQSGVVYEEEFGEQDDWCDIPTTRAMGHGDAEDLACWRAAELQEQGVMAWPTFDRDHGCLHPKVRYADGRMEDPATIMGMRGHSKPCVGIASGPDQKETRCTFCMKVFHGSKAPQAEQELAHETLRLMLGALTIIDVDILKRLPMLPSLYDKRMGVFYEIEPAGREDWQDVLTNFRRKSADCVPVTSRVLRHHDRKMVPIGALSPGDRILGDREWTTVKETLHTGKKLVREFGLSNGETLRCTPEHRVFSVDGTEVRAKELRTGMIIRGMKDGYNNDPTVLTIHDSGEEEECCDIETDSHRFYLPDSHVLVHNCEDLASHRAAELQVKHGIEAWPSFTYRMRPSGAHLYHIQTRYPDGRIEDPSRRLGMGHNTGI
jgi:hypothetical protein